MNESISKNRSSELVGKYVTKFRPLLLKLEKVLLLVFLAGIILKVLHVSRAEMVLSLSLMAFAIMYFLMAFVKPTTKKEMIVVLNKVGYVSMSVGAVGTLWSVLALPNAYMMIMVSMGTMLVCAIGILSQKIKSEEYVDGLKASLIRMSIVLLVVASLFMSRGSNGITQMSKVQTSENNE